MAVEEASGAGLLVRQGGNCYVILPTHLHGRRRDGIRLGSERSGEPIGAAKIVHVVPGNVDISVGLVRGGMARTCGGAWQALPRRLDGRLAPGTELVLRRPRQRMVEGRRLLVHSAGFRMVRLVPAPGEAADLVGGTSGAVAFAGETPVAMVLQAEDSGAVLAIRMDEVVAQLARFLGGGGAGGEQGEADERPSDGTEGEEAPPAAGLPPGDPLEVVDWTAHPLEGAADPAGMLEGEGPWIFALGAEPVRLTLRLADTDRLSRIRLRAREGTDADIPRRISIVTDSSADPDRPRPSSLPAPEMTPDGRFDLRVGERFARTVTITIGSSWGDGERVRLDAVSID